MPIYSNSQHAKRYQKEVVPQEMLNSLTLCQYFIWQLSENIPKQFPESIVYNYMDDILLSDSNADTLERMFEEVGYYKLLLKTTKKDSINYLGYKIGLQKI